MHALFNIEQWQVSLLPSWGGYRPPHVRCEFAFHVVGGLSKFRPLAKLD
jgi:hypothetical protein